MNEKKLAGDPSVDIDIIIQIVYNILYSHMHSIVKITNI